MISVSLNHLVKMYFSPRMMGMPQCDENGFSLPQSLAFNDDACEYKLFQTRAVPVFGAEEKNARGNDVYPPSSTSFK